MVSLGMDTVIQRGFPYIFLLSAWIVVGLAWMSSLISNVYRIIKHKMEEAFDTIEDDRSENYKYSSSSSSSLDGMDRNGTDE